MPANGSILMRILLSAFQEIYSGCCTVAANLGRRIICDFVRSSGMCCYRNACVSAWLEMVSGRLCRSALGYSSSRAERVGDRLRRSDPGNATRNVTCTWTTELSLATSLATVCLPRWRHAGSEVPDRSKTDTSERFGELICQESIRERKHRVK